MTTVQAVVALVGEAKRRKETGDDGLYLACERAGLFGLYDIADALLTLISEEER